MAYPTAYPMTHPMAHPMAYPRFCPYHMVYSARCFCKNEKTTFGFITLNARFVDYFPRITQSIKGINEKAWQFVSMIC